MKVKKRQAYAIAGLLILISGIFVVYALVDKTTAWHSQDEIIVDIGGCYVFLDDAVANDWLHEFVAPNPCLSESQFPPAYHLASEIIVEIDSVQVTLQDAINQSYFKGIDAISASPSPAKGHFATEIDVDAYDNLQVALSSIRRLPCVANAGATCPTGHVNCINLGTIQCYGDCSGSYKASGTSCGTNLECDGAGSCDPACVSNQGATCTNNDCISGQIIQCDGSCAGGSNVARGTEPSGCSGNSACDGAGSCIGYAANGCGSCPFGWTEDGKKRTCNINDLIYVGKYQDFETNWLGVRTTTLGDWTTYEREEPWCAYKVCVDFTWTGTCKIATGSRDWRSTNWKIKPAYCTPSCTITYPCGTPYSYADGCGGTCSGTGTDCGYGETCYQGSCCTPDCDTASDVPCGTWSPSGVSDGCGGTCNRVYGTYCSVGTCTSGDCVSGGGGGGDPIEITPD